MTAIVLPITGTVDPGFLAGLNALSQGMTAAGVASETAGARAQRADGSWSQHIDTLRRGAQAFNETHQAITTIVGTITAAVARVGALADEQARLDSTSRRLGLDFDAAAAAAGRFVDETEAMGVANRFASADINLTQQQLNDVMRVAGATADTLGTDVAGATDILREALIRGREGGLQRFGEGLAAVAGGSHTVEERMAALHTRAGQVTEAVDDSAAAMARFADRIEDSERTVATALVAEIGRLDQVASSTGEAASAAIDWDNNLKAIGSTLGYVSSLALSGLQIVGGAIGSVVGGITGTISIAAAGIEALVNTRSLSGARSAMTRELAAVRDGGLAMQSADILAAGIARAEALAADQGSTRTSAAPDAPPVARPRSRTPGASRGGGSGRGGAANDNADMTFTEAQANADALLEVERVLGIDRAAMAADRARAEVDGLIAVEAARQGAEEMAQSAADKERTRMDEERARLEERAAAHETFTGRLAELNDTQVHGAQRAAEFTNGAFESMGRAIGTHVQALIDGKESVGQALQGMLSDTLISVGKEAVIQGGMEMAKGVAALAGVVTAPLAPGHFAAGAAFLAVGAAAGVAGAALAPSAAAPSAGAGAGNGGAGGSLRDSAGSSGESMAPININYYAPVIGGREATDAELGTRLDRFDNAARQRLRRAA